MGFSIDHNAKQVLLTSPDTEFDVSAMHDFVDDEQATAVGMSYPINEGSAGFAGIFKPEGRIDVKPKAPGTVFSQIILVMHPEYQIKPWGGSGVTRLEGGTIVGGIGDDPVVASGTAGDITYFISPVDGVVAISGSGITEGDKNEIADKVWDEVTSGHTTIGTFGKLVQKLLTLAKFLGLK